MDERDVARRVLGLLPHFGTDTGEQVRTMLCRNVDVSQLPTGPDLPPLPEPSILHTIVKCNACGDDCWIGPVQKQTEGVRICYLCFSVLLRHSRGVPEFHSLNPDEDKIPRRRSQ